MQPNPIVAEPSRFRAVLKLLALGVLVLLLMIPVAQLVDLVRERKARQLEVREELAQLWGGPQSLGAVVLAVPTLAPGAAGLAASGVLPGGRVPPAPPAGWAYFLPGTVRWSGTVEPQRRHRGLFEVTLYEARLSASGWFARPDPAALGIAPDQVDWAHAQVLLAVRDPRGLQQRVVLRWAGRERPFAPGLTATDAFGSNLQAALASGDLDGDRLPFSLDLVLRGSEELHLLPLGDDTTAELSSPWPHPSFVGSPLPRERQVAGKGFTASWSVPYFGRGFPQRWRSDQIDPARLCQQLADSAFGVNLVQPADPYQQTERAVKYAVLFILLTFTTVFVLELLSPVRLHPMQYLLVGAALCLFYLLLLALAEHVGLGWAYAAATAATVLLVTLYVRALLAGWGRALSLGGVLAVLYGWLYTLLRAEDYALLLGALGLFGTLAGVMFVTRRLDWATLRFRQPALG
jgi:inner membrane protein